MPNLRTKTWTTTTPATVNDAQYWEDHLISDEAAAKAASSVQTVNSTAPDANGNVDVVALPPGGTTGQVLTKVSNTSGDADWSDPASGGHTIQDADGVVMARQSVMQFLNAEVTNDSVNGKTVVDCQGEKGDPGDAATVTVGTTTTLSPGSSATVANVGTTSAAVFNFSIPRGADGTNGTDGTDGVSVTGVTLIGTSGRVKTYRMTFSNSTYFDFQVTDGADGTGAGDMLQSDYDSTSAVYNEGGIVPYVASVLPVITNTYSGSSEDGMSGKAVKSAIDALDGTVTGTPGAANTLTSFSQTDGKIAATFSQISITKSQVSDFPTIPVITNTYSGSSDDGMSGKAVKQAIDALDGTVSGSPGAANTITAFAQTDGKVTATFGAISILKSQISDFPTIPTVSVSHTGTASASAVSKQQITVNSTSYDVDGSVYMESTANSASFAFTNAAILATSAIDVYTDTWGDNPSDVEVVSGGGTCNVTFSAAQTRTVRIYIK